MLATILCIKAMNTHRVRPAMGASPTREPLAEGIAKFTQSMTLYTSLGRLHVELTGRKPSFDLKRRNLFQHGVIA